MTWHKPTQSFSSSDNFFKVLWSNALKDEMDKFKFNNDFNNMNKFKFTNNDIKAFNILGVTVGLKWRKCKKNLKGLSKNFTLI